MNPFDLGPRLAVAPPVFLTERVQAVRDITKRTAAGAGDLANSVRYLTENGEISVVDGKNSIRHAGATRSSGCQIAYQDRRGSSRAL